MIIVKTSWFTTVYKDDSGYITALKQPQNKIDITLRNNTSPYH